MIAWSQIALTYWEASCGRFTMRITCFHPEGYVPYFGSISGPACNTLEEAQAAAVELGIQDLKRSLDDLGWQPEEKVWFEMAQAKLAEIARLVEQCPANSLAHALKDILTQTETL